MQVVSNQYDNDYHAFIKRINLRLAQNTHQGKQPLFTTDAKHLFAVYLTAFSDPIERQRHHCSTCRKFFERFGHLVVIDNKGQIKPAIWHEDDAPPAYQAAVVAMVTALKQAKITGVFRSAQTEWGTAQTAAWSHFAIKPPKAMLYQGVVHSAGQWMAHKREDFRIIQFALGQYSKRMLQQAVTLLRSESLYRSEAVLGHAEWLLKLYETWSAAKGQAKDNLLWLAVANAPAGFCHPRGAMIGTLLDDLVAGLDFDDVAARFAAKMHPLSYMRPKALPTAAAVAEAEKIVAKLKAEGALARRFARLDEVLALWKPRQNKAKHPVGAGVFAHLTTKKQNAAMDIPAITITWEKFQRVVLSHAERIELCAPARSSYSALVTAVHAKATPILQWDSEKKRNPVSWYVWHGGSPAKQFGLVSHRFYPINAVTLQPNMWHGGFEHQGKGVMFIIDGAADTRNAGSALFPSCMKNEFHSIRKVIEAYSKSTDLEGIHQQSAAGLLLQSSNQNWDTLLRVWRDGQSTDYRLERWD